MELISHPFVALQQTQETVSGFGVYCLLLKYFFSKCRNQQVNDHLIWAVCYFYYPLSVYNANLFDFSTRQKDTFQFSGCGERAPSHGAPSTLERSQAPRPPCPSRRSARRGGRGGPRRAGPGGRPFEPCASPHLPPSSPDTRRPSELPAHHAELYTSGPLVQAERRAVPRASLSPCASGFSFPLSGEKKKKANNKKTF